MSRKANRKINRATTITTAEGCTVTTKGNEITLEAPKLELVVDNTRELNWLARDIFSTPYAEILA